MRDWSWLAVCVGLVAGAAGVSPAAESRWGVGSKPVWSADGSELASITQQSFNYVIDVHGYPGYSAVRTVPIQAYKSFLDWSQNGRWYAVSGYGIGKINGSTGAETALMVQGSAGIYTAQCSWSPDATQLAFETNAAGDNHIWVMNADGSNLRQVTFGPGTDSAPAWSPDGTAIAYSGYRPGAFSSDIYLMTLATGIESRLTDNLEDDIQPRFTDNGNRIIFVSDRTGTYDVWIMDTSGAGQTQLTSHPWAEQWPDLSPDNVLAYESDREIAETTIWTLDIGPVTLDATVPPAPGMPAVQRLAADSVRVQWPASTGAEGYHVYRRSTGGSFRRISESLSFATSFMDGTAPPGQAYAYAISSVNRANNESPLSSEAILPDGAASPTPTGSATPSATPTGMVTSTPTPLPPARPKVPLAGTWNLSPLAGADEQTLGLIAVGDNALGWPAPARMEIRFQGIPSGLEVADDGLNGDGSAGDGLYGWRITLDLRMVPPSILAPEIMPVRTDGQDGLDWPYLHVLP